MPRLEGATYFSLKGGLNTEASPLNIPPADCISIENVDINIDGSIQRRRGIDFLGAASSGDLYLESGIADYSTIPNGGGEAAEVPAFSQFNPLDKDGNLKKHVVLHLGNDFYIYDYESPSQLKEIDSPKQTLANSFTEEQALFESIFLQDQNKLFVLNTKLPLQYINYDATLDTFTLFRLDAQYRDDSDGTTSVITNIISDDTGWQAGCFSGSRLWLGGSTSRPNTIYYSQTITNGDEHEKMYQEADPFSETDNLLVDTDGGSIKITGAEKILAIVPLGGGVIILANNGVWSISGQDGFRPTSYSINKISDVGVVGQKAWCNVEQQLVFFGISNVYTILQGNTLETPEVSSIGDKILTFYNSIPLYNRESSKAVYSPDLKKLYLFTNFDKNSWIKSFNPNKQPTMLRDILVLDVRLAAWSKYRLSEDDDGSKVAISDATVFDGGRVELDTVIDSDGNVVTEDDLTTGVVAQNDNEIGSELVTNVLLLKKNGTSWKVAIGEMSTPGVVDFSSSSEDAESNASHITMAHQMFKDVAHRKFAPYLIPVFTRIESGVLDSDGVDLTPGGCMYRVDWDWSINSNSSKYGTLRQAYRPYTWTGSMFDGVDNGTDVVTSKLKIRGMGDVLRIHFESDEDKDFKLLGWQLMLHAKGRV